MFRPFWVGIQITFHYLLGWLLGGKGRYKLPSMMHVKFPSTENNTCVSFGSTPPTQDASRHQESYMFKTGNPYVFKPLHLATPDVSLKKSCQKRIGTVLHRRDFFSMSLEGVLTHAFFWLVFLYLPPKKSRSTQVTHPSPASSVHERLPNRRFHRLRCPWSSGPGPGPERTPGKTWGWKGCLNKIQNPK